MTTNLNGGNSPEPAGNGTPTPTPSEPTGQTPPAGEVPAWFKSFTEQNDQRFSQLEKSFKTTQGQARQTESQFRKWMSEIERMESRGVPRDEAISQLERSQQEGDWRTTIEKQIGDLASLLRSSGNANGGGQMVTEVLTEFNLNPNDPAVAKALQGKTFANRTEVEALAGRLFRDLASTPNPSAATAPSQNGGGNNGAGMTPAEVEQKSIRLNKLYDNYSQNKPEIEVLEKELNAYWAKQPK